MFKMKEMTEEMNSTKLTESLGEGNFLVDGRLVIGKFGSSRLNFS